MGGENMYDSMSPEELEELEENTSQMMCDYSLSEAEWHETRTRTKDKDNGSKKYGTLEPGLHNRPHKN